MGDPEEGIDYIDKFHRRNVDISRITIKRCIHICDTVYGELSNVTMEFTFCCVTEQSFAFKEIFFWIRIVLNILIKYFFQAAQHLSQKEISVKILYVNN